LTAVSPIEPAYAAPPRPTPADTTFEALYEQHSSRVFGYCLKWLRSREEAEDAVQTTFLYAMRGLRRGVVPLFDEAWLLAIARYKALSARRRRTDAQLDEATMSRVPDTVDDPEISLQKKDRAEALRRSLPRLSPEHRELIDLAYYHSKSVKEIAEIVGINEATVKTRMFYARKKLAESVVSA